MNTPQLLVRVDTLRLEDLKMFSCLYLTIRAVMDHIVTVRQPNMFKAVF